MRTPIWITESDGLRLHSQQISVFGGSSGVRDLGLLQSALARPLNLWAYRESKPSLAQLAAAYAFGISSNHPFVDGNKRTALMASFVFLEANGMEMTATSQDAFETVLRLAAGEVTEAELAAWFERNTAPRDEVPANRS